MTGEYGVHVIKGTQECDVDGRYLAAAGTMKHFQLYDLEGTQREPFNPTPMGVNPNSARSPARTHHGAYV